MIRARRTKRNTRRTSAGPFGKAGVWVALLLVSIGMVMIGAITSPRPATAQPSPQSVGLWHELGPRSVSNQAADPNTAQPDYAKVIGRVNPLDTDGSGTIYAGSDGGGIWKSTDAGNSWLPLTDNIPAPKVTALRIDPGNNQVVFAALNTGERDIGAGLYRSQNAGLTWTSVGVTTFGGQFVTAIRVDPSADNRVYVAMNGGGVAVSDNNGLTFPQVVLANQQVYDLAIAANGTLYAAIPHEGIYLSTDHGGSWQLLRASSADTLKIAIARSNNQVLYVEEANATGATGILRSLDGGQSWQNICDPAALLCLPDKYPDGSHQTYDYIAVDDNDPNIAFVGLVDLWETTSGASGSPTWTDVLSKANLSGNSLHVDQRGFVQTSAGYFFANDGGVYATFDGGHSFSFAGNGLGTIEFYSGSAAGPGGHVVVGGAQDNGVLVTNDGRNWTQGLGGDGTDGIIDPQNLQHLFADVNFGDTYSTTNGGVSWTESSPFGLGQDDPFLLAPLILQPGSSTTLYLGAHHLWRTTDGTQSWQEQASPTTFTGAFQHLSANQAGVLFGTDGSHNALSSDSGASWRGINPVPCGSCALSDLAIGPTGNLYETTIDYTIPPRGRLFLSGDGGNNWAEIDSGLPITAFHAVAIDPSQSSTIFLGTDAGIFRTDDQGMTWRQLGQGLPDAAVLHIDINSSESTLTAFTLGRGAWSLVIPPAVNPAPTTVLYNGEQIVNVGATFTPAAQLSSPASSCQSGQTISFLLDSNPLTGASGPYLIETTTTAATGGATGAGVKTGGWLDGVYALTASFGPTANCLASADMASLIVGSAGDSANGGGWYRLPSSGRINFAFIIQTVPNTNPTQYKGQFLLINSGKWRLKGSFSGTGAYTKTSTNQGGAAGIGDFFSWNQVPNGSRGDWQLAQSEVSFTISLTGGRNVKLGTCNGTNGQGCFGIHINYTPVSPHSTALPNSAQQPIKGGAIKLN